VAAYFFDTSALVKRYATESGTACVTALLDPAARHHIFIARITGAEMISAIMRKKRGLKISEADAVIAATLFRSDLTNRFRIVEITPAIVDSDMTLAETHTLRGYDAVQLAAVLHTQARRQARGLPALSLITADEDLLAAGAVEGLMTDNPNNRQVR
jgi:predicted nucleic acid-binding protein